MNATLRVFCNQMSVRSSSSYDRTESDNRMKVMFLEGMAENNLSHTKRWESTKPPYAERHVRWCERSENESRRKTTSFSSYSIVTNLFQNFLYNNLLIYRFCMCDVSYNYKFSFLMFLLLNRGSERNLMAWLILFLPSSVFMSILQNVERSLCR